MTTTGFSRRNFLAGLGAVGAATALGGCVTSTGSSASGGSATGPVTVQSNLSAPAAKAAMQALIDAFNKKGGAQASLNTVASETFRTQLPTYLTSSNPPDVMTWYAGSVARSYADKGLLLDVSDVWTGVTGYSDALKQLSTDNGKQIFIPINYYFWGCFYRKSNFAKWGVQEPTTWAEFLQVCETIKSKGVTPIGLGADNSTPWVASGWFDYLNIRINGANYHRELLAGQHSFTDPQVHKVFDQWKTALPYFDPKGTALSFQDATTNLLQGRTGLMLIGTFLLDTTPKEDVDDISFFRFPVIDPSVPVAEEAPTDGFFASSRTKRVQPTKDFLKYLTTVEAQEAYLKASSGSSLPANPAAKDAGTALITKGKDMLNKAADLTQFFNRDSSDALQPTADTALIKFIQHPEQIDSILTEWQTNAKKIWAS
ncbi:ABC transporter substrate-binding protein [Kutzneria kofuensis]|uniref:Multiple sugar transport system substrate-binding protein n=1 Tax=Kutzneria kofuensis TaxID=103725 RepID=A0A7W9NEF9_9PSEU|nr:substrate-binding domain-containing protein [Kutzneria kofuensis]MBB5888908.1 multiple sugar transport system substrate-binding protein [Kutzneria kofuensis]